MARYVVTYEGSVIETAEPKGAAARFFVTARVTAPDEEAAEARGRLTVYRAWTERMGGGGPAAKMPHLDVSELSRCGWLRARLTADIRVHILWPRAARSVVSISALCA